MPSPFVLAHESGTSFYLPRREQPLLLGRYDATLDVAPDIDLGRLDFSRRVSRRHAMILVAENGCLVWEEPCARNGTYVNGHRILRDVSAPLFAGDVLAIAEVQLVLRRNEYEAPTPLAIRLITEAN